MYPSIQSGFFVHSLHCLIEFSQIIFPDLQVSHGNEQFSLEVQEGFFIGGGEIILVLFISGFSFLRVRFIIKNMTIRSVIIPIRKRIISFDKLVLFGFGSLKASSET